MFRNYSWVSPLSSLAANSTNWQIGREELKAAQPHSFPSKLVLLRVFVPSVATLIPPVIGAVATFAAKFNPPKIPLSVFCFA
jgi:hypothetical protein